MKINAFKNEFVNYIYLKQKLAKYIGKKIYLFDAKSRRIQSREKRDSWITDQFFNPHETLYTPSEILNWFQENRINFVNLIPHTDDAEMSIFSKKEIPKFSLGCINFGARSYRKKNYPDANIDVYEDYSPDIIK